MTSELSPSARASVLVEALPYILRFWGKVVVVKYGGNALVPADGAEARADDDGGALVSFAQDVVLMRSVGILPVVVHGGGPQIGELMARLGKVPEFRDGMRVTDAETLEIASMVLIGKVNREIVSAMNVHGSLAVGLSGEDAKMITATARDATLGFVGDVEVVDPSILHRLLAEGIIPVVATIAGDAKGQSYNVNADAVAGAIAAALKAEKLVYMTDVEGLRADPADRRTRCCRQRHGGRDRRHGGLGGGVVGDDPQGRGVRPGGAGRRGTGPHPRRPRPARAVARGVHRPRRRHDGLRAPECR